MGSAPLRLGDGGALERPTLPSGPPGSRLSERARRGLALVRSDRRLALPVGVLALLILFALVMPIVWDQSADKQDLINSLEGPSFSHPFGTDQLGRDVFARVASGARISLVVASLVTLAGALVGGLIGLLAGTLGGPGDGI